MKSAHAETSRDSKRHLTILQRSPLDAVALREDGPSVTTAEHWVPSRFNIRATADDGRLVLWNTLSGAIAVFQAHDVAQLGALLTASGFRGQESGFARYLVEKGFVVRQGTDEYRKFLHLFGKTHYRTDRLELILMSSEDCNFRCTYCYEKFERGTMRPEVRAGIKRLIEKRISTISVLTTEWFGGEPLYGWDAIQDLAPYVSEIARKHDVIFSGSMTTNGYLLTPDVVDKLFAWRVKGFQITLDGLAHDHDKSRPARDGSPTFDTIFQNLKSLAHRKDEFGVRLRVNFSPENASGMGEFVELVSRELGSDSRFKIFPVAVGHWGGDNDANVATCTDDQSERLRDEIVALAHKRGLGSMTIKDSRAFGAQVCYAARPYNFVVGATGKVMKCTVVLDKSAHNVVGQIGEDGVLRLNDDNMALWTEPAYARDEQCQNCVALPACNGISCPLPRIEQNERPCVPTRTKGKKQLRDVLRYANLQKRTGA